MVSISAEQLEEMKHCLGLNHKKKPYRNYFYCDIDDKNWNDLVSKRLATKHRGWDEKSAYFRLTFEAVKTVYGKPISEEQYNTLR